MIDRRRWSAGMLATTLVGGASRAADKPAPAPAAGLKVLRYAFESAESSLDPAKINDLYSRTLVPHIFEGLYTYDHLARPVKTKPLTADGMPVVSADFRVWTVKVRPGIYFADDPAFKGKRRELVAADYAYTFKRFADPANKSPVWSGLEDEGIVGLAEVRQAALDAKQPFDYDREVPGLRALDRATLRIELKHARPRFLETLASTDLFGAVAREAIEHYGDQAESHPVGTGPFRLAQWRRSSFIAFERNPDYRERYYDAEPTPDDTEGQAILAKLKGRRLPLVDRVEISIVEEEQPRWLAFVNNEADLAYRVGFQFATQAMPNGKVAPNLVKRGIRGYTIVEAAAGFFLFNMDDPVVGGYTPEKVALRRAFGLGLDTRKIIAYAYNGLGAPAQGATLPHTSAYDPKEKTEFSDYDPAKARALLDLYGWKDRDGDGFRETPDGSPLVLNVRTQAQLRDRRIAEVLTKNMQAIGIRVQSLVAQWPDNLKATRAGNFQMWSLALSAAGPDAGGSYARFNSRQIGGQNMARFRLPAFDALYDRILDLPDGPERLAALHAADHLALAYMPYKFTLVRLSIDMAQPQLVGYRHPVFWQDFWQYVDIDDSLRRLR